MPLRARCSSCSRIDCQPLVPDRIQINGSRQFLDAQDLRMHAHHQHFFVLAAVEDADAAAFRQATRGAPEEVVIEFQAGRFLETEYLAAGGIDALHHRSDSAVLAGRVHGLKDQQHGMAVACGEHALQLVEVFGTFSAVFSLVRVPARLWRRAGVCHFEAAVKRYEIFRAWCLKHRVSPLPWSCCVLPMPSRRVREPWQNHRPFAR